jgi:hypothetical protein
MSFILSRLRLSNNYRAPGLPYNIHHPNIVNKKWSKCVPDKCEISNQFSKFIPKNFQYSKLIESIRTGEFLGPDYPYNLLPQSYWNKRRYNVQYKDVPDNISLVPRVDFYSRLNVWSVAWRENGRQYYRWFRVQVQGFQQAKYKAEAFQKMLMSSGRLDSAGRRGGAATSRRKLSKDEYIAEREKREKSFNRTRMIRRGLF